LPGGVRRFLKILLKIGTKIDCLPQED